MREFFGFRAAVAVHGPSQSLSEITHKRPSFGALTRRSDREREGLRSSATAPDPLCTFLPMKRPEARILRSDQLASPTYCARNKYAFIGKPISKIKGLPGHQGRSLSVAMEEAEITFVAGSNATFAKPAEDGPSGFNEFVVLPHSGGVMMTPRRNIDLWNVSPRQWMSLLMALIPFLPKR